MTNRVPDRWEAYKAMGRQVPGSRFICFKVPLREEIVQNAVRKGAEWFCPRTLMDHCHNLGLVIDLTFTTRFYDPRVFTNQGIRYAKILTQGKVVPKAKIIKQFYKIVNTFLEENKENDKLIGVHCTHGLNRTGYLVCRYMIEHLGIPPDQAIADFNSARGHEQERNEYLDHLRQMKWQQEPPASESEKDGEGEGTPTPTRYNNDNRRRSKRNLDTLRDEDGEDESWNSGPVRKWPRTPHTQRQRYGPNYAEPSGSSTTPSPSNNDRRSGRHKVKTSPYGEQQYYDSNYRGRVAPQYDFNFYQQQGSGMGPRQSPKWSRNVQWDNSSYGRPRQYVPDDSSYGRPRQYKGPRQYSTPPQREERETLEKPYNDDYHVVNYNRRTRTPVNHRTPVRTPDGPGRNPFSPGVSDNVFSPGTPKYGRRYTKPYSK